MVYVTKNEFTKKILALTDNLTKDELQNLIIETGDAFFSKNRNKFIQQIQLSIDVKDNNQKEPEFDQDYFTDFTEFIEELKSYSNNIYDQEPEYEDYYDNSYGDDEHFNFDEDMADRIQEYFNDAYNLFKTNHKVECRKILCELLPAIDLFDDTILDIDIDTDLLSIPRVEAYALCLNSIYFISEKVQRVNELLKGFQLFSSEISNDFNLKTVMNCDSMPLPDWDEFIEDWIKMLKTKKDHWTNYLLMEAVTSFREVKDLQEIAIEIGSKNHQFIALAQENLVQNEAYTELEKVINYAFTVLPSGNERSFTGKSLVELGKIQAKETLVIKGSTECFMSKPSLESFKIFIENHENYEKLEEAKILLQELAKNWKKELGETKKDQTYTSYEQTDYKLQVLFFLEEFDYLINYCNGFGSLGWEYGYNPKRIVISDMLALLIKNWNVTTYIKQLLQAFLNNENMDILKITLKYFDSTKVKAEINSKKFYSWVKSLTEARINAILDEKHRKSYWKAALLLKALKELQIEMEGSEHAQIAEKNYLKKYSRLRAFQSEYKNRTHEKALSYC